MSKRKRQDTDLANDDETEPSTKLRKVIDGGSIEKQNDAKQSSNITNSEKEEQGSKDKEQKTVEEKQDSANCKLPKEIQELYEYKAKYKLNDNGSLTFYPTPNCEPSETKFDTKTVSMDAILKKHDCKRALTYSHPDQQIIQSSGSPICSFIKAAIMAWSKHYPFRFKVEHIWLLILQSIAVHVDQNAEKLRSKYVEHDGKKELIVYISANPSHKEWESVVENFAEQIDKNTVDDTAKLFECDFSTSSMVERISTKVTIMDICKNYFDYTCMTECGFPEITLDGKKEDWIKLKQKTEKLLETKVDKKFGAQWAEALLPLLDRFIVAFGGEIDCVFWNSMIKRGAEYGSGGYSWFSGWFNILFPFIRNKPNRFCVPYTMDKGYVEQGLNEYGGSPENDQSNYPMGIASAPVKWDLDGTEIKLKFLAGFVGYKQDPKTLELCPNVGWCIAESMSDEEIKQKQEKRQRW